MSGNISTVLGFDLQKENRVISSYLTSLESTNFVHASKSSVL